MCFGKGKGPKDKALNIFAPGGGGGCLCRKM